MSDEGAVDDLGIVTGEAVTPQVRSTSWALRAAGAMIDGLAELGLFLALLYGIAELSGATHADQAIGTALVVADLVLSFIVAPAVFEIATHGRSLGKFAIGARIVREDGGGIAFRHSFIRSLVGIVELLFTLGSLAAVVGLLNRRAKRIGGFLAGTGSQHERGPRPTANSIGVPPQLAEWAEIADVARPPAPLARRIAAFLVQGPRMTPASRSRLAVELATEAAPFVAPAVETDPQLLVTGLAAIPRDPEVRAPMVERDPVEGPEQELPPDPPRLPERR